MSENMILKPQYLRSSKTAAEMVCTNDEISICVNFTARSNKLFPPAWLGITPLLESKDVKNQLINKKLLGFDSVLTNPT